MKRGFEPIEPYDAGPALVAFWLAIAVFLAIRLLEWKAGWLWP